MERDAGHGKVVIVLPVYNEAKSLGPLLHRIQQSLSRDARSHRIVIVDDGSTDRSLTVARSFARSLPMEIISHPTNEGLGRTIRDGLRAALQGCADDDVIVTMDADNSQPPERIPAMVRQLAKRFDMATASRYAVGSKSLHVPICRRLLSFSGNLAYCLCARAKGVRDYTCGFRAYKAAILKRGFRVYGDRFVSSRGFECMGEILIKLWRLGARVVEVPFTLDYGAKPSLSKMKLPRTVLGNLKVLALGAGRRRCC